MNGKLQAARQTIAVLLLSAFVLPAVQIVLAAIPAQHVMKCCKRGKSSCCHKSKPSTAATLGANPKCGAQCGQSGILTVAPFLARDRISGRHELTPAGGGMRNYAHPAALSEYLAFLHQRPPPRLR
ncbi:MAG TPA: hypothetical protein VMZ52_19445 [Bryobacteraceae bacterium]|nr:hypothetical protein [Bryobacteraceae bacterium]